MFKNIYANKILPKILNRVMKGKDFQVSRQKVVSAVSGTVLEIGFGSGLNLPYYKNINHLYALEPYSEIFNLSKKNRNASTFPITHLECGAEKILLPDNSVDYIVSTWVFCSVQDPEKVLNEIARVLKPTGIFSFVEHGISDKPFVRKLQHVFTPLSKMCAGGCHLNRDIKSLFNKNRFKIMQIEQFTTRRKPLLLMYRGLAALRKNN